jgi:hypothetical protein
MQNPKSGMQDVKFDTYFMSMASASVHSRIFLFSSYDGFEPE